MKELILFFTEVPFFFIYIYFLSFFFFKRKNFFKKIILINSFFLLFFSLPISSYLFKLPLYPTEYVYEENINKNYSIILVPTAGFKTVDGKMYKYPSKTSLKRFDDALNISNSLDIPIFISGGKTNKKYESEAEILINNININLNKKKIVLEKKSLNSYETGKTVSNYLNNNNYINNIILVTDLYHYKRMSGVLKKNDVNAFFIKNFFIIDRINKKSFIPNKKNFSQINQIRYSYFGLINYLFLNKIDIKDITN